MRYLLVSLGSNLVALACVIMAGYLVTPGRPDWAWFLFIGLLCVAGVSFTAKPSEEHDKTQPPPSAS